MRVLDDELGKKSNNLQLIKFTASILVIVSHAFALTGSGRDWFGRLTDGKFSLGALAVYIFFFFSGLLVTKSMFRTKTAERYFRLRINRIMPPLFLAVFLCVAGGAFLTTFSIADYITDIRTWTYFGNAVFILQHSLPGVFEENIYGSAVNGSLWTMPVEVLCYVGCFAAYKWKLLQGRYMFFLTGLMIGVTVAGKIFLERLGMFLPAAALCPCCFFVIGMAFYVYRERIVLSSKCAVMCIGIITISMIFQGVGGSLIMLIFLPYLLAYMAFAKWQCPEKIAKPGKYSYTIYLCAFPIQQTLVSVHGGDMGLVENMILSIFMSVIVGAVLAKFSNF